ncbi:MAG: hypothetical protein NTW21_33335 [Verrucomicrobia bacterium]|nr:hypothetical protein [Verrucomicrobiota bacterium]
MPSLTDPSSSAACPLHLTEDSELSLLAANDPVFTDLKPDDFKGYFRFRIATAFPAVIGPEMYGRHFGFHPQVLVNSYRSLLHQQTNLGHLLKAYGTYRDRIIGSIVGVSVANLQRGGGKQKLAASADAANTSMSSPSSTSSPRAGGKCWAITPPPARIIDLKAAASDQILFAAMVLPDWEPGDPVAWRKAPYGHDAGEGTVMEVILHGSHTHHGMTRHATPADPLLDLKVRGKNLQVLRHASSVRKSPRGVSAGHADLSP